MANDWSIVPGRGGVPAPDSDPRWGATQLLGMVKELPPDAVLKVFDIIADVFHTQGQINRDNRIFASEMERLRETNASVERRLEFLKSMVISDQLSEEAKLRLVDAICQVVVK